MPLLATYTFVGVLSMAGRAQGCIAHGLPTQPDWAIYTGTGSFAALTSIISRTNAAVWAFNSGGTAVQGETVAQFVHSLIR